ncbi:cysteine protease [Paecilomyces lecythidis]|uniref:Cysteine protease n=1 Tax=Paecilomyces lecythidis TaxID=3004212 RepID=A0ABR3YA55_9EURO
MSQPGSSAQKTHVAQALRAERDVTAATSQRQALEAAIDAAEHYMRALKLTNTARDKQKLDAKCKELLEKAEKIKDAKNWQQAAGIGDHNILKLTEPVSTRKLTTREEIILLEGAKLNGFLFPPWTTAPDPEEFELENGEELFRQVTLSFSMIHPYDQRALKPKWSHSGKYIFRFYFNGCYRKVVIDDRLPSSKTARTLYVVDRNNPNLLWPALLEKAYLKVRGGSYDFPGSNSGTDLWVLSGWIPEQIFLHDDEVTPDQLWKRLLKAFHYGDVLVTIGTGKLTEREERVLGLIGEHDYAILDMKESKGRRQMLVKNPWAAGEGFRDSTQDDRHESSPWSGRQDTSSSLSPGCFWMDGDKIFQNFENLYLNWNPGLFKCREDIHFSWDLENARGTPGCFSKNPQFAIYTRAGGSVWLLLSKHFRSSVPDNSKSFDTSNSDESEFISIYIFKKDGEKVSLSDGAIHRGPYVDSPNTLMRIDMPPNTTYTIVVAEQSIPALTQNFTLSSFSTSPVKLSRARDKYAHVETLQAAWTKSTAGGNAESARYPSNPQFSLQLFESTDVAILLETPETELATHVKLFWSNGKRVSTVRNRDIAIDSGDYRRGCAVAEANDLAKGLYTIVCSTFAPDQLGKFTLSISTTKKCQVRPLAAETAGKRVAISDIGVLSPGVDRILAPLTVPRLTRVRLIARSRSSTIAGRAVAPSPMLMTVELGQGPYKKVLATSEDGDYSDAASGIRVDDFDLQPGLEHEGGVWIVVERISGPGGQVEDHIEVEALAEVLVEMGEWFADSA